MRLRRRPGAFVAFVDAFTEEMILRFECALQDLDLVSFRLYDSQGLLVADSDGPRSFPKGLEVSSADGELLLHVPAARDENVRYRLYSSKGALLSSSDGLRTQIYGGVRIEGNKALSGRPPNANAAPSSSQPVGEAPKEERDG